MRRLLAALGLLARPDVLLDLHVYGGLLLVAIGVALLSPPFALITLGLGLAGIGLLTMLRAPRPPGPIATSSRNHSLLTNSSASTAACAKKPARSMRSSSQTFSILPAKAATRCASTGKSC